MYSIPSNPRRYSIHRPFNFINSTYSKKTARLKSCAINVVLMLPEGKDLFQS